jgi:hypothetical protein
MPRPTEEQERAVALFSSGGKLKLAAFAGTGKTTTLQMMAEQTRNRGLYLAFNRPIADAAHEKFPRSVTCKTTHQVAWHAVQSRYDFTATKMKSKLQSYRLANDLKLEDRAVGDSLTLDSYQQAYLIVRAIRKFCLSADDAIDESHVSLSDVLRGVGDAERQEVHDWVLAKCRLVWQRMTSPTDTMPLGHDGYQKLWSLDRPVLDFDYVLLDEAQDTNHVVLHVLTNQQCQIVYVGDKHQQIYEWRGAVNAMEQMPADNTAALTQSFRFGSAIAEAATKVLRTMHEVRTLEGNPRVSSRVVQEGEALTYLARTNTAVFSEVVSCVRSGIPVAVVKGVDEISGLLEDVKRLQQNRPATLPDLFGFKTWPDVIEFAGSDEGQQLRPLVNLVSQYGVGELTRALRLVKRNERDAHRIVSTVHKAKGREWQTVRLLPGFATAVQSGGALADEDIRVFYVAMTRAIDVLVVDASELAAYQTLRAKVGKHNNEMVVQVTCRNGHRIAVPVTMAGKEGNCRTCSAPVRVPAGINCRCPNGHSLRVPYDMVLKSGACTLCRSPMTVPVMFNMQ